MHDPVQMDGLGGQAPRYRGMLDCFAQVLATEGFGGLYKGFATALIKIAPTAGISWLVSAVLHLS